METKNGSPEFYRLLDAMGDLHNRKSHDYASNASPFENYHFAGKLSQLFKNSDDAGFVGRIGEKLFRLANLENSNKLPLNESIADTELDLCVIMTLWMADRIERRKKVSNESNLKCLSCGKVINEQVEGFVHDGGRYYHEKCFYNMMQNANQNLGGGMLGGPVKK